MAGDGVGEGGGGEVEEGSVGRMEVTYFLPYFSLYMLPLICRHKIRLAPQLIVVAINVHVDIGY